MHFYGVSHVPIRRPRHNASRFPFEIGCKNTNFFRYTKKYFDHSAKKQYDSHNNSIIFYSHIYYLFFFCVIIYMAKLTIQNFGPIKDARIEIKKFNIIIGPQSSGKSCILKVASFCRWLEKRIELTQKPDEWLKEEVILQHLVKFHKMEGYFRETSKIRFESPFVIFSISYKKEKKLIPSGKIHLSVTTRKYHSLFNWQKSNRWNYQRPKIAYIPAERNIVAAIPNWFDVRLDENNIKNYMSDWDDTRSSFDQQKPLQILNLGANYYYNKDKREDWIDLGKNTHIRFTNASSGIQSITPILVLLRYFTFHVFNQPNRSSHDQDKENAFLRKLLRDEIIGIPTDAIESAWIVKSEDAKKYEEAVIRYEQPQYTSIYLEEPEENLFPSTQYELIKWITQQINSNHYHDIVISTHSPYILSSFNNLIQAYDSLYTNKDNAEIIKQIIGTDAYIPFENISVYAIKDGRTSDIKDKEVRLISQTELDAVSDTISTDFSYLLEL